MFHTICEGLYEATLKSGIEESVFIQWHGMAETRLLLNILFEDLMFNCNIQMNSSTSFEDIHPELFYSIYPLIKSLVMIKSQWESHAGGILKMEIEQFQFLYSNTKI